jgi:hypothetical protein
MKIGFFGDSFCAEISNFHSYTNGYDTYIKQVKDYYKAEITHLGTAGSSYWDVMLRQLDKKNLPDVCVFVWTEDSRLYHPIINSITSSSANSQKIKHGFPGTIRYNTWKAAEQYYTYLYDGKKASKECTASFYYFDREVLPKLKTKILHMWSFNPTYQWQTGVTISTPMYSIIDDTSQKFKFDLTPNHIAGHDKNKIVADRIINAIDNYE